MVIESGIEDVPNKAQERNQTILKKIPSLNTDFQIHKRRKYCGSVTDIVALKTSDSYSHFLSQQREGNRCPRATPKKIYCYHTFSMLGKHLF